MFDGVKQRLSGGYGSSSSSAQPDHPVSSSMQLADFLRSPCGGLELEKKRDRTEASERNEQASSLRSGMLTAGAQKVLQARRSIKAFQDAVEDKRHQLAASITANERTSSFSENVAAVDQSLSISERLAAVKEGISKAAARADEKLGGLSQRVDAIRQEFAEDVADLSEMASAQKQKMVASINACAMRKMISLGLPREIGPALDPEALCFFDVKKFPGVAGKVALTIDDAPCHQKGADKCMLQQVRELLTEFDAKATFFLCTDHVPDHESELLDALREGHEVANHCGSDRTYSMDAEDAFENALLESERVCDCLRAKACMPDEVRLEDFLDMKCAVDSVAETTAHAKGSSIEARGTSATKRNDGKEQLPSQREAVKLAKELGVVLPELPVRWFRAPHADLSETMRCVLKRHGFTNVLTDCFANDTIVEDAGVISEALLSIVEGGSIVVIHVPERGFREHNLAALRLLLEGLQERGLQAVTKPLNFKESWFQICSRCSQGILTFMTLLVMNLFLDHEHREL
eukprot:TRINITY_DN13244_c0_g1_i2.p1 TRINITY_DN13244_c0_g1~~TRINITY_DN13244_c0_g1_i2.p1  ORF type:complete len:520 (+),score=91.47 TRINITY_DN13244_c0_g1_i2:190-1749(+)